MNYNRVPRRMGQERAANFLYQTPNSVRGWLVMAGLLVILGVLIAGILDTVKGSAPHSQVVSHADFGEKWPFTVDSGELTCYDGAVVFASGGIEYAVNGIAMERSKRFGWVPVHESPVWKDDPARPGTKTSLNPVLSWVLASCRRPLTAKSGAPEVRRGI